ncbi:acetyl-CoA carboxylase [Vibrio quintilis]|uniref:Biotin carboxyl carrier protein of acetyl-CoA carboxylase n=1 Tax=Vibrio quintilis TaxID=1117707 RepID=A0A1M7YSZ5_9VIBR|nr:acetyl-CoA carboxylase [Vibrio quintilis]SHO55747.1 Biotin carboxyl carrier protein of acetyl-CoA carboxylase [Vibrio quintilis]
MAKHEVISPLPGVFYRRPAPDAPEFITEGQPVTDGQVIGLIEVMKQFSELTSDTTGTLISFSIEDAGMIEPGQIVAVIETA